MTFPFKSRFRREFREFLQFKRSLGCKYVWAESLLRRFDRFIVAYDHRRPRFLLKRALLAWLARDGLRKPVSVTVELGVLREFCLFLRRSNPRAFVPGREWAPQSTKTDFVPHIFSLAEIRKVLGLASRLTRPAFRADLYRALILVLYCTGIRVGEALRLRVKEVDLKSGVFFIAESKGRSRWVPFHSSLLRELKRYWVSRSKNAPIGPEACFFVSPQKERLPTNTAQQTISRLFREAGLKPATGRAGPRPYDFRHAFAVHRLTRWYRAGVDIHARLPWLSAYMGHDDILGTETYLTATPELMALAAARFRSRFLQDRSVRG